MWNFRITFEMYFSATYEPTCFYLVEAYLNRASEGFTIHESMNVFAKCHGKAIQQL